MSNYGNYYQQGQQPIGFTGFGEAPPPYSSAASYPSAPPSAGPYGGYGQQNSYGSYPANVQQNISGVYIPPTQQDVYTGYQGQHSAGQSYAAGYSGDGRSTKGSGGFLNDVGSFASKNKLEIAGAALSYKMGGSLGKLMAAGMGADLVNRYQKEHKQSKTPQPPQSEYYNTPQKHGGVKTHGVAGDLMSGGQQLFGKAEKYVGNVVGGGLRKQLNSGSVVQLVSRVTGKALQIVKAADGRLVLDALGLDNQQAFNTHFTVIKEAEKVILLHNNYNYVAIQNGLLTLYMAGQGAQPSHQCRLKVHEPQHKSISFESVAEPGCSIGILPNGEAKFGGATRYDDFCALFFVKTVLFRMADLETALKNGGDFAVVRNIAKNRSLPDQIRAKVWQVLLGVANKSDPFIGWDELYNLPEQASIRQDCQKIADKLGNPESDRPSVTSDLESVITLYSKNREVSYEPGNGWCDILQLLLCLKLTRNQLYNTFFSLVTKYIPRGCEPDGRPFDLFRLLLLYHDPQLCSYLDTRMVMPHLYAKQWFNSLLCASCNLEVALKMLDVYLQQADPFLVFFMALVMLDYHGPLFGSNLAEAFENITVHSLLCLPVSVPELLHSNHLNELVNKPVEFHLAVQSLGAFKQKTHPNDHLCFMGSGRDEEDKYLHMVIAGFLQKGSQYVSLARGGYAGLHEVLRESLSTRLKSHSVRGCIVCNPPEAEPEVPPTTPDSMSGETSYSLFTRMKKAVKSGSVVVKDKVVDYIVNTPAEQRVHHVAPNERGQGRRYRNMTSVFSIGEDGSESDEEDRLPAARNSGENSAELLKQPNMEKVKLSQWFRQPDMTDFFECHQVDEKGYMYPGFVTLSRTHLFILRRCEGESDWATVVSRRPLSNIHKITSKKRIPELLTFKYGYEVVPGQQKTTALDRFLVPKAGECAKAVKTAILTLQGADLEFGGQEKHDEEPQSL